MENRLKLDFSAGQIYSGVDLKPFNTLGVPAQAKQLVVVETTDQLVKVIAECKQSQVAFCLLGEGSNVVFNGDFDGLIILMRSQGIELVEETSDSYTVDVAAGENWHQFVEYSLSRNWYGLENLALIPGLVGAAPIQNIGAYGVEVKNFIDTVTYFDTELEDFFTISKEECQFDYRDSVFKHALKSKAIITKVRFHLLKVASPNLCYRALAQELQSNASAHDVFNMVVSIRSAKLPNPAVLPNAGSFFKNPVVSLEFFDSLRESHPDVVYFEHEDKAKGKQIKLAAAWLIDQLGWKERSNNGLGVHQDQALVLVNRNAADGSEVLELARQIKASVAEHFGIAMEIEPTVI